MLTKYLWRTLVVILSLVHIVLSDGSCQVMDKPKLQIIFVADYTVPRFIDGGWFKTQTLTASHLVDFIKKNFDAEFAATGFVDYPDTAGPRILEKESCYIFLQELTADKDKIVSALSKDLFPVEDSKETLLNHASDLADSLTTAMLFSAVDKRLLWNSGFYDGGKLVRKIMVPMVYRDVTMTLETPGNRKRPNADGTDTCENSLIPDMEQLDRVLFDNQFTVVNSIFNLEIQNRTTTADQYYEKFFSGLFVPYYQAAIPKAGEYLEDADGFDYNAYAKILYDIIWKEVMSCDWEDPVGYNTLGL